MRMRKAVKPGDIVAVPLDEAMVAVGIVLHVSSRFKNSMMIGFYDYVFESIEEVDRLGGDFIDTPNYTGVQLISKDRWQVIGHSLDLLAEATIPKLRVVTHVYYKDEVVHHFGSHEEEEARKYPLLKGQGGIFIENKLREYFKRDNQSLTD